MAHPYEAWIADYVVRQNGHVLGKCRAAVTEMCAAFPELREVRGHLYCSWGQRAHAWCETPEGLVVDPTQDQFPDIYHYEEWRPGDKVTIGKCMDCGVEIQEPIFDLNEIPPRREFCNDFCYRNFATYLNMGVG
jgi:hypothetical protein